MEEPRSNGNGKAKAKSIVVRADDRRQPALERLAGAGANGEQQCRHRASGSVHVGI